MAEPRQQTRKKRSDPAPDEAAPVVADTAAAENLLIFRLAGESFALRLGAVAEIIRLPDLAHMPLVPPSLLGLANLRGVVLPVLSLRALLHLPELAANESTRVVVMRSDAPLGFVVDGIERLLTVTADELQKDDAGAGTIDPAVLKGIIKGAEGRSPIKLLSPSRLLGGQFARLGISAAPASGQPSLARSRPVAVPAQALVSVLSFCLSDQEYALPLDRVREIIPLPDHLSELPRPETAVLGVVTLRDRLLPLVSLRALLGLPAADQSGQRSKVVVMSIGDALVGVVVDATREILRLDPDIVDPAPALLTRGHGDAAISSICRLDGGRCCHPTACFDPIWSGVSWMNKDPAPPDSNLKRTPWQTSNSSFSGWATRTTALRLPR
jgi:purine-binding chemotaxis protein CheW